MKNRRSGNTGSNGHSVWAGARALLAGLAVLAAAVTVHGVVYAAQEDEQSVSLNESGYALSASAMSGRIRSSGRVRYEYAVIDGDDLRRIDAHISEKKNMAAGVLIRLGTRFRQQSGEYVYDRNPDAGQEEIDLSALSWSLLTQAAKESQTVPAGLSVLNPEAALRIEGVEERTDFYEAASEDNLSSGKAAWVDGRLLLGNGEDNNRAYRQGVTDGGQGKTPENLCPIYAVRTTDVEIRHTHVGSQAESEGTSGCYYNYSETITKKLKCDTTLHYLEPIWVPNENEPGGGTWHGGFYTCSHHGGTFASSGVCGKNYEKRVTEWKHDVICGLENMLYARLMIKAEDAERPERTLRLSAVLEEGEGYDRLIWQEGDELVWTDDKGNVLGTGSDLTVCEPGIYRCSINVANEDINSRMAEAVVRVSGLVMPGN